MRPERAARLLANLGLGILVILMGLRWAAFAGVLQQPAPLELTEPMPLNDSYTFSADGRQVYFRQGVVPVEKPESAPKLVSWHSMSLEGGLVNDAEAPQADLGHFALRSGRLFRLSGDGSSLNPISKDDLAVHASALSPDGETMAFAGSIGDGAWGLYLAGAGGQLDWLGNEVRISDLAWSPDGKRLAFIAPRFGVPQVLVVDRAGGSLLLLTGDPGEKSSPVWVDGGQRLAYLRQDPPGEPGTPADPLFAAETSASPPGASAAVYLIGLDGSTPAQVGGGLPGVTHLQPIPASEQIAFSAPAKNWPRVQVLFTFDPATGKLRRVYPPLSVDGLTCPGSFAYGAQGLVQFTLSNSGLQPASVPVILRAGADPLPLTAQRDLFAARVEKIDLAPGETSTVEWPVQAVNAGVHSYISVLVDLGEIYPMSELHCSARNTYYGLPNLPFLPFTLPLAAAGMLLVVPYLRHQKKRWLWALFAAYPVVIVVLIALEAKAVR